MPSEDQPFTGYRFLVIEDEPLVAMDIAYMIEDLGGTVAAIAYRIETAAKAIREIDVDCATVDVNLGGELSFPLVALLETAKIPFAFCTAYADSAIFPKGLVAPRIMKPFELRILRNVIADLLHSQEAR